MDVGRALLSTSLVQKAISARRMRYANASFVLLAGYADERLKSAVGHRRAERQLRAGDQRRRPRRGCGRRAGAQGRADAQERGFAQLLFDTASGWAPRHGGPGLWQEKVSPCRLVLAQVRKAGVTLPGGEATVENVKARSRGVFVACDAEPICHRIDGENVVTRTFWKVKPSAAPVVGPA
jgi:hypothetical protein